MAIIQNALLLKRVKVINKAARYATQVWKISFGGLEQALRLHAVSGFRIFQKYATNGNFLLANRLQANINLDGEEDEDRDVYIEIILTDTEIILISNAHNHDEGYPRLPK